MKRVIIFLVRKRLGLKRNQLFKFTNQKTRNTYYFTKTRLIKIEGSIHIPANVSLNWLLNDECEIEKLKETSR